MHRYYRRLIKDIPKTYETFDKRSEKRIENEHDKEFVETFDLFKNFKPFILTTDPPNLLYQRL